MLYPSRRGDAGKIAQEELRVTGVPHLIAGKSMSTALDEDTDALENQHALVTIEKRIILKLQHPVTLDVIPAIRNGERLACKIDGEVKLSHTQNHKSNIYL